MVIGADDVSERRQPLFYSLYLDLVRYGIAKVLKLLVGSRRGNKETFPIPASDFPSASFGEKARMYYTPSSQSSYDPCSCNCCATYRNDVLEFCLEHAVEVLRRTNSNQCIGVCKGGEDANPSCSISLAVIQFLSRV